MENNETNGQEPLNNEPKSRISFSGVSGAGQKLKEMAEQRLNWQDFSADKRKIALVGLVAVSFILSAFTVLYYAKADKAEDAAQTLAKSNETLEAEVKTLEDANAAKDDELKARQSEIQAKDVELMTKEEMLAEINAKLKQANDKVSVISRMNSQDKKKLRDYQTRLMDYEAKYKTLTAEVNELKREREADQRQIRDLTAQVRSLERELTTARDENRRLNEKLRSTWRCSDFEFFAGGKKQKNISFKKGKLHSLEINFLLREAATNKAISGDVSEVEVVVKGLSETNNDFKRATTVAKLTGTKAVVKLEKEKFSKGIYRVEVRHKGAVIGDAKFRAETIL